MDKRVMCSIMGPTRMDKNRKALVNREGRVKGVDSTPTLGCNLPMIIWLMQRGHVKVIVGGFTQDLNQCCEVHRSNGHEMAMCGQRER